MQLGLFALSPCKPNHGVKAGTGPGLLSEGAAAERQAGYLGVCAPAGPLPGALPRGFVPAPHLPQVFAQTGLRQMSMTASVLL